MIWWWTLLIVIFACDESELINRGFELINHELSEELVEIKATNALFTAQAIAHVNFTQSAHEIKRILASQWTNGMFPHVLYNSTAVTRDEKWLPGTFIPGPGIWKNQHSSGITAFPLHSETVLRIFRLVPTDEVVLGVPMYSTASLEFLCDSFPSLWKWHEFLQKHRQAKNGLIWNIHPWETLSMGSFGTWYRAFLEPMRKRPDFQQIMDKMNISKNSIKEWTKLNRTKEEFQTHVYLIDCMVKYQYNETLMAENCPFKSFSVEFNSILLKSSRALVEIGAILQENRKACPLSSDMYAQLPVLEKWNQNLSIAITAALYDPKTQLSMDQMDDGTISGQTTLTNFLPFFGSRLNQPSQLMTHFLSSGHGITYGSCDTFGVSVFECHSDHARMLLPSFNYLLYRGLVINELHGMAGFLRNQSIDLLCKSDTLSSAYDATTGMPIGSADSILTAAAIINMILPPNVLPPSPDTPPINRSVTIIVLCVELLLAVLVASSCVIFSVYFIVTRPPEGLEVDTQDTSTENVAETDELNESLLTDEHEDPEYGSFLRSNKTGDLQGAISGFISSINPWRR